MTLVMQTREDAADAVELVGVGVVPAYGKGGIVVEKAALTMPELQSPGGVPLEDDELHEAAQAFADARNLVLDDIDDEEVGALADHDPRGLPAIKDPATVAQEEFATAFALQATPQDLAAMTAGDSPQIVLPDPPAEGDADAELAANSSDAAANLQAQERVAAERAAAAQAAVPDASAPSTFPAAPDAPEGDGQPGESGGDDPDDRKGDQ